MQHWLYGLSMFLYYGFEAGTGGGNEASAGVAAAVDWAGSEASATGAAGGVDGEEVAAELDVIASLSTINIVA